MPIESVRTARPDQEAVINWEKSDYTKEITFLGECTRIWNEQILPILDEDKIAILLVTWSGYLRNHFEERDRIEEMLMTISIVTKYPIQLKTQQDTDEDRGLYWIMYLQKASSNDRK